MGERGLTVGWRLLITHRTVVGYHGPARASYNEARMTPVALPGQNVLETRLWTDAQVPVWTYRDYWGTEVSAFDIQAPHEELQITSRATVETSSAAGPDGDPMDWSELTAQTRSGRLLEFLMPTPRTTVGAELAAAARQRVAGLDPRAAAAEIAAWVYQHVTYMPGSTGVQTSAKEAWDQGQGVCQDIAHLTVALLRTVGLPARYVSGYLFPKPDAAPGAEVTGQSHAWVEYWTGEWAACDPTNDSAVGHQHVVVAAGRDYADVPPLKGIYHGAPSRTMEVTVSLTRLA
ncbi:MAG TPA: transglutaminase family protein [Streptosporangiaceae bacterium]|nr:transglutaminase family protein [Streptosporangiaceae bacterium]